MKFNVSFWKEGLPQRGAFWLRSHITDVFPSFPQYFSLEYVRYESDILPPSADPSTKKMASTDRDTLLALFRSQDGENWEKNDKWDTEAALSLWRGVEVDDQGRVAKLRLYSNNLGGIFTMYLHRIEVVYFGKACRSLAICSGFTKS